MTRLVTRRGVRYRGSSTGGSSGGGANPELTQLNTAVAGRSSAPARWLGIGQSLQEGWGATTPTNTWFQRALVGMRAAYPTTGVAGGRNYIQTYRRTGGTEASPWITETTFSGTLGLLDSGIATTSHKTTTMSAGASITFTVSGTSVDVDWVRGPGGGTFTWRVDGGTTTSVSCNGTYLTQNRTRITFGSRGSHTVTIACSTAPVYLSGLFLYDQDENAGLHGYDGGWSGATIATPFLADTGTGGWPSTLNTLAPDLVTIELNGNDGINGTNITTFEANARSLIGILKGLTKVPSIVWLTSYQVASSVTSTSFGPYDARIKTLAAELGFGVLSWYDTVAQVGTGSSVGLFTSDGIHPNNTGHQMLADSVVAYLTAA